MRFVTPGLSSPRRMTGGSSESVTARLNFLRDRLRVVEHVDRPLLGAAGRRHLALGVLQVAHARADRRDAVLGDDEDASPSREAGVEALRRRRA